ncbi:aspartate/glutamate racemase family protein [Gracilibacillus alcaliphilus]|uniref:aspartate/glutamate racemase family protein n=1 Tax=Gracilibacillus alcaliphilus TaxID=1401441 RepID=UPI00195C7095|nr:aspartate/glutamate racemase family protein [Gracilibacillus alcaliphilus]MBM7677556.1 Asp/Glu/hydantoin racemase [Gracilibacillus alcaliphilus]
MNTLAIVHTTPVTIEPLKILAKEKIPDYQVINFVDDSILPQLVEDPGHMIFVKRKIIQYMKFAEETGADIILNACSSVGEVVGEAEKQLHIPVVRIDEAMAEQAVSKGTKIAIAATLATTLTPTKALLEAKAKGAGKQIELETVTAHEAYQKLMNGEQEEHDHILKEQLEQMAHQSDLVVLAQASMARVAAQLPKSLQSKFLSSPALGMQRVKEIAERI